MKKGLLIPIMLLLGITGMSAQHIDGTWKVDDTFKQMFNTENDELDIDLLVYFEQEAKSSTKSKETGVMIVAMPITGTDDEIGVLGMIFSLSGTYTRNGNEITTKFNKDDVDIKITQMDLTDDDARALVESSEESWNMVATLIESQVKENSADEMKQIGVFADLFKNFTVSLVSKDRLEITIEDETIGFDRYEEE